MGGLVLLRDLRQDVSLKPEITAMVGTSWEMKT
jgi:hypothetical protein